MSGVQIHVYNTALFNKEDLLCVLLVLTVYNNPPIIVPSCQCQVIKDINPYVLHYFTGTVKPVQCDIQRNSELWSHNTGGHLIEV